MIEITYRGHNGDIRAVINPRYISLVDDLHGEPWVHMERGISGFALHVTSHSYVQFQKELMKT